MKITKFVNLKLGALFYIRIIYILRDNQQENLETSESQIENNTPLTYMNVYDLDSRDLIFGNFGWTLSDIRYNNGEIAPNINTYQDASFETIQINYSEMKSTFNQIVRVINELRFNGEKVFRPFTNDMDDLGVVP